MRAADNGPLQDLADLVEHIQNLDTITEDVLKEFLTTATSEQRLRTITKLMNSASEGFHSAANPYVRDMLVPHSPDDAGVIKKLLLEHGASRSTTDPQTTIPTYSGEIVEAIKKKWPYLTFGAETEMAIPAIPRDGDIPSDKLKQRLHVSDYRHVEDDSLHAPGFTRTIEQTTKVMKSRRDIEEMQGKLSMLEDWGAISNETTGVHVHTGIDDLRIEQCLENVDEETASKWNANIGGRHSDDHIMTPYRLLFLKQLAINQHFIQESIFLVNRNSKHGRPNGPVSPDQFDT